MSTTQLPAQKVDGRLSSRARRVFLANLIAQVGIVVTGGLVRVTGSGLGCPTWPECVEGSLVPTASQAQAWHKYVEFGNRTLTILLIVLAVMALLAARGTERRAIRRLAAVPILGTVAQAFLGGVTVLTGLSPSLVGAHLLLSVAIVAGCVVLVHRSAEAGDHPRVSLVRSEIEWFARLLVVIAGVVIVLGTVVTGSGPHSGDLNVEHRLPFDARTVAWLHADVVLLFIGLIVAMWLALRLTDGPRPAQRWVHLLVGLSVVQGVVGYTQWFAGLPWALVVVHMALAMAVWVAALQVPLHLRARGSVARSVLE
ncbi:MAG: COX15/CtaA family protein [Candidatus Nanopelagicales bacterium]